MAAIYRQRWQVELFFKSIKQNLRIKTFVGTSANALKIQIWTALIALLLVRFLELRSRLKWHTSRFIALLRRQLFVYRDLFRFLDYPFEGPVRIRQDHLPGQAPLFAPDDLPPEGQPQLTRKEKLRQRRIIMRVPNPAPAQFGQERGELYDQRPRLEARQHKPGIDIPPCLPFESHSFSSTRQ